MPLFTFECKECTNTWESLQKGKTKEKCPNCGSLKTSKVFGTFATKVTNKINTSTPVEPNDYGMTARVPIIADKISGRTLGTGPPQFRED